MIKNSTQSWWQAWPCTGGKCLSLPFYDDSVGRLDLQVVPRFSGTLTVLSIVDGPLKIYKQSNSLYSFCATDHSHWLLQSSCPGRQALVLESAKLMISWNSLDCSHRTSCSTIKRYFIMAGDRSFPTKFPSGARSQGTAQQLIRQGNIQG